MIKKLIQTLRQEITISNLQSGNRAERRKAKRLLKTMNR